MCLTLTTPWLSILGYVYLRHKNWVNSFFNCGLLCRILHIWHHHLVVLPAVHHSLGVFKAMSCIGKELLYIGSYWPSCLCSSMWRGPQENITYEFIVWHVMHDLFCWPIERGCENWFAYSYYLQVHRQTKIFSWTVTKWGLFFNIVPFTVHTLHLLMLQCAWIPLVKKFISRYDVV